MQKFSHQNANQIKQRAQSSYSRFVSLGKEALAQENYTEAERCFQQAEHYIRQLNGIEARESKEPKEIKSRAADVARPDYDEVCLHEVANVDENAFNSLVPESSFIREQMDIAVENSAFEYPISRTDTHEKDHAISHVSGSQPPLRPVKSTKRTTQRKAASVSTSPRSSVRNARSGEVDAEPTAENVSSDGAHSVIKKRRIIRKKASPSATPVPSV
ncbi:MAG: hypothetical protein LBF66_02755 [Holosporales bacterium]|jgi:hypothetical protein|nr:hypothetical protein [Holosporales bacterium]